MTPVLPPPILPADDACPADAGALRDLAGLLTEAAGALLAPEAVSRAERERLAAALRLQRSRLIGRVARRPAPAAAPLVPRRVMTLDEARAIARRPDLHDTATLRRAAELLACRADWIDACRGRLLIDTLDRETAVADRQIVSADWIVAAHRRPLRDVLDIGTREVRAADRLADAAGAACLFLLLFGSLWLAHGLGLPTGGAMLLAGGL
jgi:hypothetical protein